MSFFEYCPFYFIPFKLIMRVKRKKTTSRHRGPKTISKALSKTACFVGNTLFIPTLDCEKSTDKNCVSDQTWYKLVSKMWIIPLHGFGWVPKHEQSLMH